MRSILDMAISSSFVRPRDGSLLCHPDLLKKFELLHQTS
jgi:hypothetical protein